MSALPQMTCTEDVDAGVLDLQVLQLRRESREVLSMLLADPDGCVYACGPEGLVQALEVRCANWPPGKLHVELNEGPGSGHVNVKETCT